MNFSASMGGTRLIRYSLCGNKQPSNDGPRGRSGGRRLACRGWGSERQTGYFYLSIPSGSCYNVSMICALAPQVDQGLGGADHQAIKSRANFGDAPQQFVPIKFVEHRRVRLAGRTERLAIVFHARRATVRLIAG